MSTLYHLGEQGARDRSFVELTQKFGREIAVSQQQTCQHLGNAAMHLNGVLETTPIGVIELDGQPVPVYDASRTEPDGTPILDTVPPYYDHQ